MLHIAVLEDNPKDFATLNAHLQRFSQETGTELRVEHFENGLFFLESGSAQYDVVFMDIEMPLMNGMEAARKMRAENSRSILIFTTNVAQYALQGYEVDAMDYLLKPIGYFNLSLKLRKALQQLRNRQEAGQKLTLQSGDSIRVMPLETLSYVEVHQHDLTYHGEADVTVRGTMKQAEAELLPHHFAKCNSCYLVNLACVVGVEEGEVLVRTGAGMVRLEASRRMKKEFSQSLIQYLSREV